MPKITHYRCLLVLVRAGNFAEKQLPCSAIWSYDDVTDSDFVGEPVEYPHFARNLLLLAGPGSGHRLRDLLAAQSRNVTHWMVSDGDKTTFLKVRCVLTALSCPHDPEGGSWFRLVHSGVVHVSSPHVPTFQARGHSGMSLSMSSMMLRVSDSATNIRW